MIGGEFPISLQTVMEANESMIRRGNITEDSSCFYYSSGRSALYYILDYLHNNSNVTKILLPNYICDSVLVPIEKNGLSYSFYPLDESLQIEQNEFLKLYSNSSVVLLVNYFGLQDLTDQINFVRKVDSNAIIIEDDVMAYFEFKKELKGADFKYTSLRKTFPIPDGGIVKTNHKLPVVKTPNTYGQYKAAASIMKNMRDILFDDNVYLNISRIGSSLINDELELGISFVAEKLFREVDEAQVIKQRKTNASFLADELEAKGIYPMLPLRKDKVPLFLPVKLSNRDEIRKRLFDRQIFCPIHWNNLQNDQNYKSNIAETELSLVIDQRYNEKDMAKIVSLITD